MSQEMETINVNDLDFLRSGDLDDLTLSQACEEIENTNSMMEELHVLSLSGNFKVEFEVDPKEMQQPGEATCLDIQPKVETAKRFADPVSDEDINNLIESHKNVNTKKNTTWAFRVFESWREGRNTNGSDNIPVLKEMDCVQMNRYLGRFLVEARKQDGPILPVDEAAIWDAGVFGNKSSESLQCTIFFYACKLFGLRGHDEHHGLACEQFTVGTDQIGRFIEFNGRGSKNYKGGLKDLELVNKKIKHYSKEGERCIADYFETYLAALGNTGKFYRRPLAGLPIPCGNQPVGVNKLKNMIKVICTRAGLKGNYTNHSGKRTCATQLYMAGVDEQEIMTRTGHRSEKSVRKYKQSCPEIQQKVASCLDPPAPSTSSAGQCEQPGCSPPVSRKRSLDSTETCQIMCKRDPEIDSADQKRPTLQDIGNGPYFSNCQVSFHYSN